MTRTVIKADKIIMFATSIELRVVRHSFCGSSAAAAVQSVSRCVNDIRVAQRRTRMLEPSENFFSSCFSAYVVLK